MHVHTEHMHGDCLTFTKLSGCIREPTRRRKCSSMTITRQEEELGPPSRSQQTEEHIQFNTDPLPGLRQLAIERRRGLWQNDTNIYLNTVHPLPLLTSEGENTQLALGLKKIHPQCSDNSCRIETKQCIKSGS